MGRVSKYRKKKDISLKRKDPKNHSLPVDADGDDHIPKSLKNMMRMKEMKGKKKNKKKETTKSSSEIPKFEEMRSHETLASFERRIDRETKEHLTNQWKDTKRISARKKEYYQRRKEVIQNRKRKRKRKQDSDDEESEEEESEEEEEEKEEHHEKKNPQKKSRFRSFKDLQDAVQFGEVAEQPPEITRKNKRRKVSTTPEEERLDQSRAMELYRQQIRDRYREKKKANQPPPLYKL
mmetsp:Transcript_43732/g.61462  ORF Transcript_43732/g.61462 Transcript_43732/m.61462 type:complete len:236 (-) Transcript_43732:20-727(-)